MRVELNRQEVPFGWRVIERATVPAMRVGCGSSAGQTRPNPQSRVAEWKGACGRTRRDSERMNSGPMRALLFDELVKRVLLAVRNIYAQLGRIFDTSQAAAWSICGAAGRRKATEEWQSLSCRHIGATLGWRWLPHVSRSGVRLLNLGHGCGDPTEKTHSSQRANTPVTCSLTRCPGRGFLGQSLGGVRSLAGV